MQPGDRLLSIDRKPVAGLTGEAVHNLLSGEVGSIPTFGATDLVI